MTKNKRSHTSRYSVGGDENEYMDKAKTVLRNRKNIRDLPTLYVEEEKALARAYELLLNEIRSDTPMSSELIKYVHHRIFADLYDWRECPYDQTRHGCSGSAEQPPCSYLRCIG